MSRKELLAHVEKLSRQLEYAQRQLNEQNSSFSDYESLNDSSQSSLQPSTSNEAKSNSSDNEHHNDSSQPSPQLSNSDVNENNEIDSSAIEHEDGYEIQFEGESNVSHFLNDQSLNSRENFHGSGDSGIGKIESCLALPSAQATIWRSILQSKC